ncbi:hypothetical protein [Oryza sativa Japonica Group]|uniref:Uncharacterized protein n=2 Tax=Oryza sativa subsp. japonica TaxID=39947 RepID=Q5QMV8_ORYSJ|nr:hypothetical protein [Oryza sativa Japonica Group]BAD73254.1 hypothetical protein [Oryza sativa Japonica Group]
MRLHSTLRRRCIENLRPWLFAFAGGGRGGKDDDHHGPRRRGRGGGVRDRNRILIAKCARSQRCGRHGDSYTQSAFDTILAGYVTVFFHLDSGYTQHQWQCGTCCASATTPHAWRARHRSIYFHGGARRGFKASALELTNPVAAGLGRGRGEDEESV